MGMHLTGPRLVLAFAAIVSSGCGGGGGGGDGTGPVDLSGFDPSVEAYTGVDNLNLQESGFTGRINAAAAPVHDGAVSVWFQDVEGHEIRFPNFVHPTMIPLEQGATYVFHAWFQGADVGGGATVNDVPIELKTVFFSGATLVGVSPITTTNLSAFGTWEMLSFSFQVPPGVDRGYVSMKATAAAALSVDMWIDDFSLDRTS